MMTEPDCDFPVTLMGGQNDVGLLGGVGNWLFELQRKENCEMNKKRNLGWRMAHNIHQNQIE